MNNKDQFSDEQQQFTDDDDEDHGDDEEKFCNKDKPDFSEEQFCNEDEQYSEADDTDPAEMEDFSKVSQMATALTPLQTFNEDPSDQEAGEEGSKKDCVISK